MEHSIKMHHKEITWNVEDWMLVAHDGNT